MERSLVIDAELPLSPRVSSPAALSMLQQRKRGLLLLWEKSPSSLQTVIRHPPPRSGLAGQRQSSVGKRRLEVQRGSDIWRVGTQRIQDPPEVASGIPESGVLKVWPWDLGHTSEPTQLLLR